MVVVVLGRRLGGETSCSSSRSTAVSETPVAGSVGIGLGVEVAAVLVLVPVVAGPTAEELAREAVVAAHAALDG